MIAAAPAQAEPAYLFHRSWDRLFIVGGALLVPVPILVFYGLQAMGLSLAACEDLVTLLVMVGVGGPHVFATYTRTFLNPSFRRQDAFLYAAALVVMAVVIGAAISSAFFDVTIDGSPPIRFVMTFFFFWAGVHIVQQNSYCAAVYARKSPAVRPWAWVDYAVMLLSLYPMAMFRMSMVDPADATGRSADPSALATQIVMALGGSSSFADDYAFRIGRVAPILPGFLRADAFWIGITVAFAAAVALFVWKTRRERRDGTLLPIRAQLVTWMAITGFAVPFFPNLDSAFQGMNAWHSFQYLGLAWLMNRRSQQRGEIRYPLFDRISGERSQWRFYGTAIAATLTLLAVVLGTGLAIETFSGGRFVMFGHGEPIVDAATGRELYRPGAVLLAYYLIGFSVLLVHYLHDGFFFFRPRYLHSQAK